MSNVDYYLWGECVVDRGFWKTYIRQAIGDELGLMALTGGVEG